jgi:hypothetical protein
LEAYGRGSGQLVNRDKPAIFYSKVVMTIWNMKLHLDWR